MKNVFGLIKDSFVLSITAIKVADQAVDNKAKELRSKVMSKDEQLKAKLVK